MRYFVNGLPIKHRPPVFMITTSIEKNIPKQLRTIVQGCTAAIQMDVPTNDAIDHHTAAESNYIAVHCALDIDSPTERGDIAANDLLRIYNNRTAKGRPFKI